MSELWGEIEQFQDSTPTEFKGKPGLAILPSDVSAAESPGTSGVAAADHVHRGVGSLEVAGTYLRGEIEIIAGDDIDVTASTTDNSITIDLEDDITVDSVNASEIAAANMDITGILRVNEIRPETDSPAEEILLNGDVSVTGILRIDEIRPISNSPTGDLSIMADTIITGALTVSSNVKIGIGLAGVDYTLTFDGETADGVLTWMEDESRFDFSAPIRMSNVKTGATQVAAGAAAGEVWATSGHASLPDAVLMIGV